MSHAIPDRIIAEPKGLSVPGEILQGFNIFYSNPNLAPERVRTALEEYFRNKGRIPKENVELRLEERKGVPFIEPWLTPADHPLVTAAKKYADEIRQDNVPVVAASGVAEEGPIFHRLGTHFIGWAPVGHGAHEEQEYVIMESIDERSAWLTKLAQHDGDLH